MNDERQIIWKEAIVELSVYYSNICMERVRKTTGSTEENREKLTQVSRPKFKLNTS